MDHVTLLQVTHIEQAMARERAAHHNAARDRLRHATPRRRRLAGLVAGIRPASSAAACATC